jgi:hypothetical protein
MKKLLLLVVDGCTLRLMTPAMKHGRLPNLQALADAGSLNPCTVIFPSITPAATASIATGCYPHEHGIGGAYWYNTDEDRIDYYGDDSLVILNEGVGKFFKDFLIRLNRERLRARTIYQVVEKANLKAACLNYMIYRGNTRHKIHIPFLLGLLPDLPFSDEIYGPSILCLGDFVSTCLETGQELSTNGGPLRRFGFEDDHTVDLLIQLAKDRSMPDFTLAYFPNYDFDSHKVGPEAAMTTLEHLDGRFGELFAAWGGLDPMLKEICVVLTSDHSHSVLEKDEELTAIRIDKVLTDFPIGDAGEPWSEDDQIVACPNMRAAQIYFRRPTGENIDRAVAQLMKEPRIDQVLWRASTIDPKESGYYVATRSRGVLHFWAGTNSLNTARDEQGFNWSWDGDLRSVDGQVSDEGDISFPDYPNAFERIACALEFENGGHLWLTAWPGYEFQLPRISIHNGGGSHGSLHALDSISPLLIAGAPPGIELPEHPRIVDVVPFCLTVLDIKPSRSIGASHMDKVNEGGA